MDEIKPSIPHSKLRLRSASERLSAFIDTAPPEWASEFADAEPQCSSGQVKPCRNGPRDAPSVAVYYRDEAEVRDGFLIALHAMGLAGVEQHSEPAMPSTGGAKP
jgi:hypothetical protein